MGNSQFNSAKDGEAGSGRDGGGFSSYPETLTTPGAPGPFSDAGFAPSSRPGDGGRHGYAGVAGGRNTGLEGGGPAAAAGPRVSGTAAGDAMDVEPKADEGEEEEEVRIRMLLFSALSFEAMLILVTLQRRMGVKPA